MAAVEDEVEERFKDIDIESLLSRPRRRPLTFSRSKSVYKAPEFTQRLKGEETVDEGSDLTLAFKVIGLPRPTLRWFKDDEEVTEHPRLTVEENGDGGYRLTLHQVNKGDEAAYRCRAENQEGSSSCCFFLTVKAKPKSKSAKRDHGKGSQKRTVSFPTMFSTIVEKVEEEEKYGREMAQAEESPLTHFYASLTLTDRSWPSFLGDWAFVNGRHKTRGGSPEEGSPAGLQGYSGDDADFAGSEPNDVFHDSPEAGKECALERSTPLVVFYTEEGEQGTERIGTVPPDAHRTQAEIASRGTSGKQKTLLAGLGKCEIGSYSVLGGAEKSGGKIGQGASMQTDKRENMRESSDSKNRVSGVSTAKKTSEPQVQRLTVASAFGLSGARNEKEKCRDSSTEADSASPFSPREPSPMPERGKPVSVTSLFPSFNRSPLARIAADRLRPPYGRTQADKGSARLSRDAEKKISTPSARLLADKSKQQSTDVSADKTRSLSPSLATNKAGSVSPHRLGSKDSLRTAADKAKPPGTQLSADVQPAGPVPEPAALSIADTHAGEVSRLPARPASDKASPLYSGMVADKRPASRPPVGNMNQPLHVETDVNVSSSGAATDAIVPPSSAAVVTISPPSSAGATGARPSAVLTTTNTSSLSAFVTTDADTPTPPASAVADTFELPSPGIAKGVSAPSSDITADKISSSSPPLVPLSPRVIADTIKPDTIMATDVCSAQSGLPAYKIIHTKYKTITDEISSPSSDEAEDAGLPDERIPPSSMSRDVPALTLNPAADKTRPPSSLTEEGNTPMLRAAAGEVSYPPSRGAAAKVSLPSLETDGTESSVFTREPSPMPPPLTASSVAALPPRQSKPEQAATGMLRPPYLRAPAVSARCLHTTAGSGRQLQPVSLAAEAFSSLSGELTTLATEKFRPVELNTSLSADSSGAASDSSFSFSETLAVNTSPAGSDVAVDKFRVAALDTASKETSLPSSKAASPVMTSRPSGAAADRKSPQPRLATSRISRARGPFPSSALPPPSRPPLSTLMPVQLSPRRAGSPSLPQSTTLADRKATVSPIVPATLAPAQQNSSLHESSSRELETLTRRDSPGPRCRQRDVATSPVTVYTAVRTASGVESTNASSQSQPARQPEPRARWVEREEGARLKYVVELAFAICLLSFFSMALGIPMVGFLLLVFSAHTTIFLLRFKMVRS